MQTFINKTKMARTINNREKFIDNPISRLGISTDLKGRKNKKRTNNVNSVGFFFIT